MNGTKVFAPYHCAASFFDGARLIFDSLTRDQARAAMEAAIEEHKDYSPWSWVTDENCIDGQYYKLVPPHLPCLPSHGSVQNKDLEAVFISV